jgi:hypothetical protein
VWIIKNGCAQKILSVSSPSVSVECGVWSVEYDSAVSGVPPINRQRWRRKHLIVFARGAVGPTVGGPAADNRYVMFLEDEMYTQIYDINQGCCKSS